MNSIERVRGEAMRHASNTQTRHNGAHARYGPIKQTQIDYVN